MNTWMNIVIEVLLAKQNVRVIYGNILQVTITYIHLQTKQTWRQEAKRFVCEN